VFSKIRGQTPALFKLVIVLLVIIILYGVLAQKSTKLHTQVEQYRMVKSQLEFLQSINEIRSLWLSSQNQILNIDLLENSNLESHGTLTVRVNEQGFVEDIIGSSKSQCAALFDALQATQAVDDVKVRRNIVENNTIGCFFYYKGNLLFQYRFRNGIVNSTSLN